MRLSILLFAVLLVFTACNNAKEPTSPPQPVVHNSPNPASPWFDVTKRLYNQVCLITPNGLDIRQSAYLAMDGAEEFSVVASIRDYSVRSKGLPDEQWLVRLSTLSGDGDLLAVPAGVFPERFVVAADHTQLCLGGITQDEDGAFNGHASLSIWGQGKEPQVIALSGQAVVQRFTSEGTVICREIPAAGLSAGLLTPAIDWSAPLQEVVPPGLTPSGRSLSWQMGPGKRSMVKQRVEFDPALPANAVVRIDLKTTETVPEIFRHAFAYHVSYSPNQWEPQNAWSDDNTLIVQEFIENPAGRQSRANHRGVFRLVAYNSAEMRRTLIAEHVESNLGFAVGKGLVFYTLRRPGTQENLWEVWAASTDGLSKRLVWRTADAQYVSVADYLPEGRLLVERQYFAEEDGRPRLHSELREISLTKLNRSKNAVDPSQVLERIPGVGRKTIVEPSDAMPPLIKVPPLSGSASGQ